MVCFATVSKRSSTASIYEYIIEVKDDLKISEENGSGLMEHYKGIFSERTE